MAWRKSILYECVACVFLTFGTMFLFYAFFMVIGFFMVIRFLMMTVSFALADDLYKSLQISKKKLVYKDFILKVTKLLV